MYFIGGAMNWTSKTVTDDGQRVEITREGPYRWRVELLTLITDETEPVSVHRTRREAIAHAAERWAIHPRHWEG
jgi:hypothetical protein